MKIDSVNQMGFHSNIRIRPKALEALSKHDDEIDFIMQLRKLERNGRKDLIIIAPHDEYPDDTNKFVMQVIEKKENSFYLNEKLSEGEIHKKTVDKNGNETWLDGIAYNLSDMYEKAKQNMIKANDDVNSYLRQYFKYL